MATKSINLKMDLDIRDYIKDLKTMSDKQSKEFAKMFASQQATTRKHLQLRIQEERKAAKQSANAWDELYGKALAGISVTVVAAIAKEMVNLTQEVADMRNQLADTATRTGLAVDTLNALRYAAKGAGLDFNQLDSSIQGFPKRMMDMARGTGEAKIAFEKLDIQVTNANGTMRESDVVFRETIAALQALESPTEKAALASQLFGESGGRLLQSLGTTELTAWVDQVERFGLDVGPEALKSAKRWQRAVAELGAMWDRAKGRLVDAMDLTTLLEGWNSLFVVIGTVAQRMPELMGSAMHLVRTEMVNELSLGLKGIKKILLNLHKPVSEWGELMEEVANEHDFEPLNKAIAMHNHYWDEAKEELANVLTFQRQSRIEVQSQTKALGDATGAQNSYNEAVDDSAHNLKLFKQALKEANEKERETEALKKDFAKQAEDRRKGWIAKIRASAAEELAISRHNNTSMHFGFLERLSKEAVALESWHRERIQLQLAFIEEENEINKAALAKKIALGDEEAGNLGSQLDAQRQMREDYAKFMVNSIKDTLATQAESIQQELRQSEEAMPSLLAEREKLSADILEIEDQKELALAHARLNEIDGQIAANEKLKKEHEKIMLRQFKVEKAETMAGIAMDTAGAVMKGYQMFGPPPSPFGIAASIAAAAAGAAQLAVVAAQRPPQFHTGGIIAGGSLQPDERMVVARTGEAVLNQRAVDNLGADGVDALNNGSGASSSTTVQQIVFEGRVLDTMVSRVIDAGGRVSQRINAGRQPPGISLVYGV